MELNTSLKMEDTTLKGNTNIQIKIMKHKIMISKKYWKFNVIYNILIHFRMLWAILCLGSFVLMVYLILPIYHKYNDFPTVTTVIETNFPVYKLDFPAVTICSNNKIIEKSLNRAVTSAYKNPNAT